MKSSIYIFLIIAQLMNQYQLTVEFEIKSFHIFKKPIIICIKFLTVSRSIILFTNAVTFTQTILATLSSKLICAICKKVCDSTTFLCTFIKSFGYDRSFFCVSFFNANIFTLYQFPNIVFQNVKAIKKLRCITFNETKNPNFFETVLNQNSATLNNAFRHAHGFSV